MGIAFFLLVAVAYFAFAGQLGRRSITMPMIFLTLGFIIGLLPGELIPIGAESETVHLLAELTLAMILFADASMLNLRLIWKDAQLPGRLLAIGLPLTVALGALVAAWLFPGIPLGMSLLIASILAPTDAALGLPVFTDRRIPIRIRNALNVESGLNDGLATPLVTLFLTLTLAEEGVTLGNWLLGAFAELAIGLAVGVALGWLGGRLLRLTHGRDWTTNTSERLAILSLALACFTLAASLGGNGFVAAFVGGILFGSASKHALTEDAEFTEDMGTLLSLAVWTMFGWLVGSAQFANDLLTQGFAPVLFAILSLTLIRMVPVALSMIGTGLRADTVALMGWFGPRGLASVVFGLLAVLAFEESGTPLGPLPAVVVWTIVLSVFAHGLTAKPLVAWYSGRLAQAEADHAELRETPELARRRQLLAPKPQ